MRLLLKVLLALLAAPIIGRAQPLETNASKAVLVTGQHWNRPQDH